MNYKIVGGTLLFLIGLSVTSSASAGLVAGGYSLSAVGTLPAPYNTGSGPAAINDLGQVLIGSGSGDVTHAAVNTSGSLVDIGTLPAPYNSFVNGVGLNNSGQACGISWSGTTTYHAFLYSGGSMTDLGTLPGYASAGQAAAINNAGQVVGDSESSTTSHAFLYSNGSMKDIGSLPGYVSSVAQGINDSGVIVGRCLGTFGSNASDEQGFVYGPSGMSALPTLPAPYNVGSEAFGIEEGVGAGIPTRRGNVD